MTAALLPLRARVSVLVVACAVSWLGVSPMAQSTAARDPATDPEVLGAQRLFSAWAEGQVAQRGLPGMVVGVVADQRLVWARGFGDADVARGVAMSPATKFRMASHSKLFTATAIMQLRAQGKLQLDDPVQQHLPWFTVVKAADTDPPVTIEELLTHASGLPREAADHWSTLEFPTRDQLRALVPQRRAAFAPETRWKYSNLAYALAGMVVEAVSGQSWDSYVTRHIFEPLGMRDSSVDRDVPGLAVGYGRRMDDGSRAVMPFVNARGMAAATGVTSTVEDMARFVSAQFGGNPAGGAPILDAAALREMHRVRMLETTWTRGSAIGFAVARTGGKTLVGHGGSYPGYITQTWIAPDRKVGVIVLTNAQDGEAGTFATQLMNTVGDAVAKAIETTPVKVKWDPAWARFAGLYRSRSFDVHVVELHERLVSINPHAPNLDDPTVLEPIGDGTFRFVSPVGGGPVGEIVRFVEKDGRVVRMIAGDSFSERVSR